MYDIVYIGERDENWKKLKEAYLTSKIFPTTEDLKKKIFTKMYWLVFGDFKDFDFSIDIKENNKGSVHLFNGHNVALVPKNKEIKIDDLIKVDKIPQYDNVVVLEESYDIVFISYNEENADKNYQRLLSIAPNAKRVHGVKGIHQAHVEAARLCDTPMFWVVDGDAHIVDDFNFSVKIPKNEYKTVHVWRSQNPVTDLVYGYGGVKLLPRELTLSMDFSKPDMTTSISDKFRVHNEISNITSFNTDPFSTWRSAFRECVKLASKTIDRQKTDETEYRLRVWQLAGADKPFGEYSIMGAKSGTKYGEENKDDTDALKKINDFEWLKEKFNDENI